MKEAHLIMTVDNNKTLCGCSACEYISEIIRQPVEDICPRCISVLVKRKRITRNDVVFYEVHSSWWASRLSNSFLQKLAGIYFSYIVEKRYNRYLISTQLLDEAFGGK